MNAIVSITHDWGIGHQGHLLVRNPQDMRFFVQKTKGGTVICGRTTFETFPGGPLKERRNIVLTRNPSFAAPGVEVAHSVDEALSLVVNEQPDSVWVIGGEGVYRQLLPYCSKVFVTKHDIVRPADTFFPNLDTLPEWELVSQGPAQTTSDGIPFAFCVYRHRSYDRA